jgi:hypothetical protein
VSAVNVWNGEILVDWRGKKTFLRAMGNELGWRGEDSLVKIRVRICIVSKRMEFIVCRQGQKPGKGKERLVVRRGVKSNSQGKQ